MFYSTAMFLRCLKQVIWNNFNVYLHNTNTKVKVQYKYHSSRMKVLYTILKTLSIFDHTYYISLTTFIFWWLHFSLKMTINEKFLKYRKPLEAWFFWHELMFHLSANKITEHKQLHTKVIKKADKKYITQKDEKLVS